MRDIFLDRAIMPELNSSAVELFIETAKNGAEEAAEAFVRAFGKKISIKTSIGGPVHSDVLHSKVAGKGLVLMLWVGGQGIAVLIPYSTGLLPDWCEFPDATEKSKLETFAQEWGMNLVPEDFFPENFKATVLQDVSAGLLRGQMELDAGFLELTLVENEDTPDPIYMVWPLNAPEAMLEEPNTEDSEPIIGPPTFSGGPPTFGGTESDMGFDPFADPNFGALPVKRKSLDDLPGYSRSVLKVKLPVAAVLARARKPIKAILELGVGSVIQFDKSCDELMEVEVGQSVVIGMAEAVKVGDKFGFRIHSILLPEERFRKVEVRREGEYRVKRDSPQVIGKAPIKSLDNG